MFYRKTEVAMIAVIFEVFPADGRKDDYLEQAARLRSELQCMDGFISVERFQSLTNPDKLLSLSFRRGGGRWLALTCWSPRCAIGRPQGHFARLSPARRRRCSRLWHVQAPRAGTSRQSCHL